MARRLPSAEAVTSLPALHPALSISLLVAWIIASIAIFASLCASCYRKPQTASSPRSSQLDGSLRDKTETAAAEGVEDQDCGGSSVHDGRITELDAAIHGPIYPTNVPAGSTSKRRLSVSLSMGLHEGLSRMKTKKEKKPGPEESLWKKTIILGGKCNIQSEEEEREGVVQPSQAVSRSTSLAHAEAVQS